MVGLLSPRAGTALILAAAFVSTPVTAQQAAGGGRHEWAITAELGIPDPRTPLASWPEGGHGKLRNADRGPYLGRLVAEYRGRVTPTVAAHVVADVVDDASGGADLTEAFLEWRPVPSRALRHRWRFGGFHPRLSLENVADAWASPFSAAFSAANTWLGEELRTFGAEWLGRHTLGHAGSPQELAFYAGAFYGNDPAGTLLFWRGWSLHDRQTRFNDRLQLPARPVFDAAGTVVGLAEQTLEPFTEIDGSPGFYAGIEWRLRRRALVRLSRYDNRADPRDFEAGHWSWDTAFDQIAVQLELPLGLGLVAQRLTGRTRWLVGAASDGTVPPGRSVVRDDFAAQFLMLTRRVADAHRLTLRRDEFSYDRDSSTSALEIDSGAAWTASYAYRISERLGLTVEWLEIESERSLWPTFYSLPARAGERQLYLRFDLRAAGAFGR